MASKPLASVPLCPDWTEAEATKWQQFLRTPAGNALWMRARAREAALCVEACSGKHDPKMAAGFSFTLNWLEGLANPNLISSAADAKAANYEAPNGEPESLEPNLAFTH